MSRGRRRETIAHNGKELNVTIQWNETARDSTGWDHERYTFFYRNPETGGTFQVAWRCGMAYGKPKPEDGLSSSFLDVRYLEENADWSTREGRRQGLEGERIEARLRRFLEGDYEFWQKVSEEVWDQ